MLEPPEPEPDDEPVLDEPALEDVEEEEEEEEEGEDEDEGVDAGVLEAAGVDEVPEPPLAAAGGAALSPVVAGLPAPESPVPPPAASFLELEYRSLYQPPPLSMKAVWLIKRSTASLPQLGQVLIGSSLIFCHSSKAWLQAEHWYS